MMKMTRWNSRSTFVLVAGAVSLASLGTWVASSSSGPVPAFADETAGASVGDFMIVVNARGGLLSQLKEGFDGDGPSSDDDWRAAKAKAAVIQALTEAVLAKGSPNKGSDDSWKSQVGGFGKSATALAEATAKKDAAAAKEHLDVMSKACGGCHRAHK